MCAHPYTRLPKHMKTCMHTQAHTCKLEETLYVHLKRTRSVYTQNGVYLGGNIKSYVVIVVVLRQGLLHSSG